MALFETFTTDRSNQILDVKKLIVNLKEQLDKANENLTELQKAEQAELSTVQATASALTQLEAAITMTAQVFGADGIQEIRDRVNGLLDTVALLESSEAGDTKEQQPENTITVEVNDETTEAQAPNDQEDENPQEPQQTTIDVESTPVDATESTDEQGDTETDETNYEPELELIRQEVRDTVTHKLDGHKVRKLAKALNIETAGQKHTFLRNEILLIIDNAESIKHLSNIQAHIRNL